MIINFDELISSLLICDDENTELIKDNPKETVDLCICDSIGRYRATVDFPYERYESYELDMAVIKLVDYIVYMHHNESNDVISKDCYELVLKVKALNTELSEIL